MNRGVLAVISGPSGSGKGTITSILAKDPHISLSVSATTRSPRAGEVNGIHYWFLSREEFQAQIKSGDMLEHNEYCGNFYGTPKQGLETLLQSGQDVILEIDVNGARQVKRRLDVVTIFILPPSVQELKSRLFGRGTEKPEVVKRRLLEAIGEMQAAEDYDYVVVNDSLEEAVEDVRAILRAERHRLPYMKTTLEGVLQYE